MSMHIKELFRAVNVQRMQLNLPLVSMERFLEDITIMQLNNLLRVENGIVTKYEPGALQSISGDGVGKTTHQDSQGVPH